MSLFRNLRNMFSSSSSETPNQENQDSIQYTQDQNTIRHADNSIIDDSEIPYLMQNSFLDASEYYKNSPNPKFHRTKEEKQLENDFFIPNMDYLQEQSNKLSDLSIKANETITDVDKTIHHCRNAIRKFYELKRFCYKTKGGQIYFQNMWEYCHNTKNPCFCFIDKTEERLKDLTQNYEERKKFYKKRQYLKNNLKTDLTLFLSEHEGILQIDVYSHFDSSLKDNIAKLLHDMEKSGEIQRIKKGSTYQLFKGGELFKK